MIRRRLCPACLRIVREADARLACPDCEAVPLPRWLRGPDSVRRRVGERGGTPLERMFVEPWRGPGCPRHPGSAIGLLCPCGTPMPETLLCGTTPPLGIEVRAVRPASRIADAVAGLAALRPDLRLLSAAPGASRESGWCGRLRSRDRDRLLVLRAAPAGPGDAVDRRFAGWRAGCLAEAGSAREAAPGEGEAAVALLASGEADPDGSGAAGVRSAGLALEWLLRAEIGCVAGKHLAARGRSRAAG